LFFILRKWKFTPQILLSIFAPANSIIHISHAINYEKKRQLLRTRHFFNPLCCFGPNLFYEKISIPMNNFLDLPLNNDLSIVCQHCSKTLPVFVTLTFCQNSQVEFSIIPLLLFIFIFCLHSPTLSVSSLC
jgi:hypothetical protein